MENSNRSFGERVGLQDDLIMKACSLAMKAHNSPPPTFLLDKTHSSHAVFFAFPPASWSVTNWFSRKPFGDSKIDHSHFPSLRRVGNTDTALANHSYLQRFHTLLTSSNLHEEVNIALADNKQLVFTGHSSGGPIAILATIWLLERNRKSNKHNQYALAACVTFGSPLVGDQVFGHALRRENWSRHFIHFLTKYDIVPRISLAPLSAIEEIFPAILCFFDPSSQYFKQETVGRSQKATVFFSTVLRNAASLTSHAASSFMGSTNLVLKSVTSFVELSPYRPSGTYVFCTGSGGRVIVRNPDAVLQMFFHCLQLSPGEDIAAIAYRSLQEHLVYETEVQAVLQKQNIVYLEHLENTPLSTYGADTEDKRLIQMALNDLGLSIEARNHLRAAGELEKQALQKQDKINSNFDKIKEALDILETYKSTCEVLEVCYYDAFRFQRKSDDFDANVKRQELAGMWDQIIEMVGRYELPDDFEVREEWVKAGTQYRRLVEPLDIANYYRHGKNDDTGPYMIKGRPWRYRCTQRWLEHARGVAPDSCSESCFWAEVEELYKGGDSRTKCDEAERVLRLETEIEKWFTNDEISKDVFLEESTLVKWWKTLPDQHRAGSRIARLVNEQGRNLAPVN